MNAWLLATSVLLNSPSVIGTVGTVEVIDAFNCASPAAADERVSLARQRVTSELRSTAAARALLVSEDLHVFDGAPALPLADSDQQQFQSQRAELRAARAELARAEESLDGAQCAGQGPQPGADRDASVTFELRMELPATLLGPLQQALIHDTDLVQAYPRGVLDQSTPPALGKFTSLESTLQKDESIVVVRARVTDPSARLRAGDIVAVELQLRTLP